MTKRLFCFLLVTAVVLAACGRDEIVATPTPFDFGETAAPVIVAGQPTTVPLAELAAEPEAYAGQFLQLSGVYKRLPLLVCSGERHPGPATWALQESIATREGTGEEPGATEEPDATEEPVAAEAIVVAVGGFDTQLRALVAEEAPITVAGYWLHWEGPVGCGKQAVPRQIWYLQATEMVSPAQLARHPLTPGGPTAEGTPVVEGEEELGTATPGGEAEITAVATEPLTPTLPVPGGETTAAPTASLPPTTLSPTPDQGDQQPPPLPATPTPTREGEEQPTITATGQPDQTPTPGLTGTPGLPATPGTATPALTGTPGGTTTPGTPTPTGQPGAYTIVEVDPLNPDESMYGLETLGPWQKQNWTITLTASDLITIGVAAEPTMNLAIAVYDEVDNLLLEQNNAPAGQLEEVRGLQVDPDVTYIVQIYDVSGATGNYFMTIVGNNPEIVLYSRGILQYGAMRQDDIAAEHRHFWYFYGQAGDVVDILVSSEGNTLMLISLYDQNADLLEDENGDLLEYVEEEIIDFTLPETGLYLIWLEEFAYDPAGYTITVVKN